ncbi:MAG: HAMP domain-containing protein, partial [Clostridia bacterium]|nr:HAMP domain-containing protein [Deltaproteobacteria bacterium]
MTLQTGRPFGIRARLLTAVLPLVAASFIVVWLITTAQARYELMTLTEANLALAAQNLASDLARTFDDTLTDALTSSRLDLAAEAIESGDAKNFVWYADAMVSSKGRYAALVVSDERGIVIAANSHGAQGAPLPHSLAGGSIADQTWARPLDAGNEPRVQEVMSLPLLAGVPSAELGVLAVSRAVIDILDEPIGAITFFLSRSAICDRLAAYTMRRNDLLLATAVVVDAEGRVVFAPRDTPTDWSLTRDVVTTDASLTWSSPSGLDYRIAAAPIPGLLASRGWRLLMMSSEAIVDAPIDAMTRRLSATFAGMLVLLAAALAVAGHRIVGPVIRLTKTAQQATRASQYVPVAVERADEVGELAQSFNAMMNTIRDHERDLETKVVERTRELADAKREVTDILDNMAEAIFTSGAEGRVNRRFSERCREIFQRPDIAGLDTAELLGLSGGPKEVATRTGFWLRNIIGGDALQWTLSAEDPAREVMLTFANNAHPKILTLRYAPIYVEGRIDRVMIIATDVTALRNLAEQLEQTEERNRTN